MSKITVLGMGAMGSRMAISLLKAGHDVTVWNRSSDKTKLVEQAGAKVADTPCQASRDAEFVISMVRDNEASQRVWLDNDGALGGMSQEAIAIESSTLTLAWVEELGQKFRQQGIAFVDAPVAGTRPQAEAGQLIYFVGGDRSTFTRVQPILQTMGQVVNYVGTLGSGMTVKLAVNSLFTVQVAVMAELIGTLHKSGINEAEAIEIITSTPICSPAVKIAATAMLARKFTPLFPIELVAKDLNYAIETAKLNNTTLPLTEKTRQIYDTAIECGCGDDNITGIVRFY